jgi:hypothetical protein
MCFILTVGSLLRDPDAEGDGAVTVIVGRPPVHALAIWTFTFGIYGTCGTRYPWAATLTGFE